MDPVRASVAVDLSPTRAFDLFTTGMSTWWPLDRHSLAADTFEGTVTAVGIEFEPRAGGSIHEVTSDGMRYPWGEIHEWDPPRRVVFDWKPNLADEPPTTIAVSFSDDSEGTLVELEHTGWDRLGEAGAGKRAAYEPGWPATLALYVAAAAEATQK